MDDISTDGGIVLCEGLSFLFFFVCFNMGFVGCPNQVVSVC